MRRDPPARGIRPHSARARVVGVFAAVPLLLALTATAAGSATAQAAGVCPPAGPGSYSLSRHAHIYVRTILTAEKQLIGCHHRNGLRTILDSWLACACPETQPPPDVWLAGRHVAVRRTLCPPGGACVASLRVTDLRYGQIRHELYTTDNLGAIVLKPNGSHAYIQGGRLIRADGRGIAMIDPGPGIHSLATSRGRLYWTKQQTPHVVSFQ